MTDYRAIRDAWMRDFRIDPVFVGVWLLALTFSVAFWTGVIVLLLAIAKAVVR